MLTLIVGKIMKIYNCPKHFQRTDYKAQRTLESNQVEKTSQSSLNSISKSGNRGNHSSQQHPKPLDNLNAEKFMCKIPESTLPSPTISPQTVSTPAEETWQADFSRYTIVEKRIWLVSSTLFSPANASSNHHRSP
jgi:hypothetical protein